MGEQNPEQTAELLSLVKGAITKDDVRENLAGPILRTLRHVLGVPEHFTGMIYDWLSHLRAANLKKFSARLDTTVERKKIGVSKQLPPGPAIAAIDAVSLQTDEDLQERWAEMLGKAMDPGADYSLKMAHVATLSEMDGLDTKILDVMCRRPCTALANCIVGADLDITNLTRKLVLSELAVDASTFNAAHSNLVRLGVIGLTGLDITPYGQIFWQSVTPPEKQYCPFGTTDLDNRWRDLWTKSRESREAGLKAMNMHPSADMFTFQ